jgi:integrase
MAKNLLLRGKNYSIRLCIPADLREPGGQCELIKSTKTTDRKQARMLLRNVQGVAERLFFMARVGMMDKGKVISILQGYIEKALKEWKADRDRLSEIGFDLRETVAGALYLRGREKVGWAEQYKAIAEGIRKDFFVRGRREYIEEHAKILLKDNAVYVPEGEEFKSFCEQFAKVHIKAVEELAKREEGVYSYDYREFVSGMLAEELPITMKQAVDEWLELKQATGLKDGSVKMYVLNSDLAVRFYGEDYPVKQLNNKELLRFVKHEQGRGVKHNTLTKRVRVIKDVIKLASANHGFPLPTYKIELKDDTANVLPYTPEELNQCFTLLSDRRKIQDWKYWAVLIGLLGGLRREEVVSLRIMDVKEYFGIWYFDIVDAKSDAGIRKTPVSDILIRLGFLDFLGERKKSGDKYLLMCRLPVSKHVPTPMYAPVPATKYGDFFINLKEKMSIKVEPGEKKDLHSLRHNYSNSLKQAGVRPDIIDELCGHEHAPGSMRSIYDEKFEIEILAENLNTAVWKCDFSLLKTWKG